MRFFIHLKSIFVARFTYKCSLFIIAIWSRRSNVMDKSRHHRYWFCMGSWALCYHKSVPQIRNHNKEHRPAVHDQMANDYEYPNSRNNSCVDCRTLYVRYAVPCYLQTTRWSERLHSPSVAHRVCRLLRLRSRSIVALSIIPASSMFRSLPGLI